MRSAEQYKNTNAPKTIPCGGESGIMLKIGYHSLKIISPTVSLIRWCVQVYAGVNAMSSLCPVLFEPNDLHLIQFWVPSHRLNFVTGEQKRNTQTIILPPSRPVASSLVPSAIPRSANLPVLRLGVTRSGFEPAVSLTPSGSSNH